MPGAPSSVLAPSSDALVTSSFLLLYELFTDICIDWVSLYHRVVRIEQITYEGLPTTR